MEWESGTILGRAVNGWEEEGDFWGSGDVLLLVQIQVTRVSSHWENSSSCTFMIWALFYLNVTLRLWIKVYFKKCLVQWEMLNMLAQLESWERGLKAGKDEAGTRKGLELRTKGFGLCPTDKGVPTTKAFFFFFKVTTDSYAMQINPKYLSSSFPNADIFQSDRTPSQLSSWHWYNPPTLLKFHQSDTHSCVRVSSSMQFYHV